MDIIGIFFIACFVLFLLYMIWSLYCNEKTYKQRCAMIDKIYQVKTPTTMAELRTRIDWAKQYFDGKYNDHMWDLVLFRDPMKRYESFNELVGEKVF